MHGKTGPDGMLWCLLRQFRRRRLRRMFRLRPCNPRLRSYSVVLLFTLLISLSALSVITNIVLSIFITSGAMTPGSLIARWLGDTDALTLSRRELYLEPHRLELSDSAIGDMQGIVRTEGAAELQDYFKILDNATSSNVTSTTQTVGTGHVDTNASVTMPPVVAVTASHVMPIAGNVTHPWWWVDFEVQNETFLEEVDQYLFQQGQLYDFSTNVSLEDIDRLSVRLPPLIPNMKNPCWLERIPENFSYEESLYKCHINYRRIRKSYAFLQELIDRRGLKRERWRLRCFPSFFLIGVAKCGTTDLYEAMTQHPGIITSELKEPEYWSRQRYGTNPWLFQTDCPSFKAQATFGDYLDTYDNASEAVRRSFSRESDGLWHSDVIFGDYSTHTMEELFFWDRSQDEPAYITANHIHMMRPETKFIVIFRDPVERAYSRYKMRFKNRGNVAGTTDDFHERMVKQVAGTEECMRTYKRRVCVYKENIGKAGDHTILVNGLYIIYLKDWLSVFPLEQFMLLRFEDYIMDRMGHIEKITRFLGLDDVPETHKDYIRNMPAANAGISIGGGMMNETRTVLQNFFSPYNRELANLTGDGRFTWEY